MENILISFKAGKRVATLGKRYVRRGGKRVLAQHSIIVPRGALSEESVYGCIKQAEKDKKGNTRYVNKYVIKYPLSSIDSKCVKDIVDKRIRDIVAARLNEFCGNEKNAFAKPLYDHQGNMIRTVRCHTGLSAVASVRYNESGEAIAFVKPANNHHVAIYTNGKGEWKEHVVTFWHAVERKKHNIPVVIDNPSLVWENINDKMTEDFVAQLPEKGLKLQFSLQQNDMFVLGMSDDEFKDALRGGNYAELSKHLYRVQSLSKSDYYFRHHLETSVDDKYNGEKRVDLAKLMNKLIRVQSLSALQKLNPHKVRVSVIGKIVEE